MKNLFYILMVFACLAPAWAQWTTPSWPSYDYPRDGAVHTTNSYEAARERACGCRVQTFGITGEDWSTTYATDTYSWDTAWARGFFGVGFTLIDLRRSQRDILINEKYMITNQIPYYLDTTEATSNETSSLSFTEYLNANNGQFPFLNVSNVLKRAGAPADYFDYTPSRVLFIDDYGWRHIPAIQNQLIATVGDLSWTNTVECSSSAEYDFGVSVVSTNMTNSYSDVRFFDIAPPDVQFSTWWMFNDEDDCPYLAGSWPSVDWSGVGCTPATTVSNAAPVFTGYLVSDINFDQRAEYTQTAQTDPYGYGDQGNWDVVLYSGVNSQNTYTVGGTVRAADPVVTNTCIKLAKTVQFYAKYEKDNNTYLTDWYLLETVAGTTNHYVKGSQFNPAYNLSNDTHIATGTCGICWPDAASTNQFFGGGILPYKTELISGPPFYPCTITTWDDGCLAGPESTFNYDCVWTNYNCTEFGSSYFSTCVYYNAACESFTNVTLQTLSFYSNAYDTAYGDIIGGYTRSYEAGECATQSNYCDHAYANHPAEYGVVVTSVIKRTSIDYINYADYHVEVDGANLTYTNQPEFRAVVWWDVPGGFSYTNGTSSL